MKKIFTCLLLTAGMALQCVVPILASENNMMSEKIIDEQMADFYNRFYEAEEKSVTLNNQDVTSEFMENTRTFFENKSYIKLEEYLEKGFVLCFGEDEFISESVSSARAVEQRVRTFNYSGINASYEQPNVTCNWFVQVSCVYNVDANTGKVTYARAPYITLIRGEISLLPVTTCTLRNISSYVDAIMFNSIRFKYSFTVSGYSSTLSDHYLTFTTISDSKTF